ncbi:riboflavin kinase, partial [Coemansia sp. 'formosensis']
EEHGLARRALRVYERATQAVARERRLEMYLYYAAKTAELLGVPATRAVYERGIEELGDKDAVALILEYARAECRLAEIDRARALYAYAAPMGVEALWAVWHEFEVQHGNEDTFKEMLRVKRAAQARRTTDARFLAAAEVEKQEKQRAAEAAAVAAAADKLKEPYPKLVEGVVVKGFGRGSKELGIPTANLPSEVVDRDLDKIPIGVYYGWAQVGDGEVYPMVMSLGWNPFYKNEKRSGEVHIINKFKDDFYGQNMKIAILGYIRPERDYDSLEALVNDINFDIRAGVESLEREKYAEIKDHLFFKK